MVHDPSELYDDSVLLRRVLAELADAEPLVSLDAVLEVREQLTLVAQGHGVLLHAGRCAERLTDGVIQGFSEQLDGLFSLRAAMQQASEPCILIGRMAGQWCKPRSQPIEGQGDQQRLTYRGDMVHQMVRSAEARRPDPKRMLSCYQGSRSAFEVMAASGHRHCFASHEYLHRGYGRALTRTAQHHHKVYMATHVPWIGYRSLFTGSPHLHDMQRVINPIAMKIGIKHRPEDIVAYCHWLREHDPERPLLLTYRYTAKDTAEQLPALIQCVNERVNGPVCWVCDPMHGNTLRRHGRKWRTMDDMLETLETSLAVHEQLRTPCHGLHLEFDAQIAGECVEHRDDISERFEGVSPLVDPQLTKPQALAVIDRYRAWRSEHHWVKQQGQPEEQRRWA